MRSDAAEPDRIAFDIPSQSLVTALEQYGATAKQELLYDAKLAPGRVSTPVIGEFALAQALQILLQGTGLIARFATDTAIVIMPAPQESAGANAADIAVARQKRILAAYYGVLQNRIRDTFCAKTVLQPGPYRVALQFWIGEAGQVTRIGLLGSTGESERDQAILAALRGMDVGATPPAALQQPFTLVIRPQPAQQAC